MRWRGERQSDNVEDRRGMTVSRGVKVGGIGGLGLVVLVVVGIFLGIDPAVLLQLDENLPSSSVSTEQSERPAGNDDMRNFVAVVLAETEDVWNDAFQKWGKAYREPKLVLFSGAVESACGMAGSAVGPFYCSADHKVYLDLVVSFKNTVTNRGSPQRHGGHGEKLLFVGRYRQTKGFARKKIKKGADLKCVMSKPMFKNPSSGGSFRLSVSPDRRKNKSLSVSFVPLW
jgi:hypothetical protein